MDLRQYLRLCLLPRKMPAAIAPDTCPMLRFGESAINVSQKQISISMKVVLIKRRAGSVILGLAMIRGPDDFIFGDISLGGIRLDTQKGLAVL